MPTASTPRSHPEPGPDATDLPPRGPGRPRDPGAAQAILDATMVELAERGFAGFTIDQVAARAGVSKATIYRRWPGKEDLAFAAAAATANERVPIPDTGSLREDLIQVYDRAVQRGFQRQGTGEALMAGLIAEAVVNEQVRTLLADYARQRRQVTRTLVERGRERGEVPQDCDADLLLELVAGPLLYHSMVLSTSVDRSHIATLVDAALRAVGAT